MTNEEINRYIHTEIMGKCWHDVQSGAGAVWSCVKCHFTPNWPPGAVEYVGNPDYCSDESPRSLLNGVIEKIIERCGWLALDDILFNSLVGTINDTPQGMDLFRVTAEQISRACVEAWKAR